MRKFQFDKNDFIEILYEKMMKLEKIIENQ